MCQTPGSVKRCEVWDGLHISSLVMSINYSHMIKRVEGGDMRVEVRGFNHQSKR